MNRLVVFFVLFFTPSHLCGEDKRDAPPPLATVGPKLNAAPQADPRQIDQAVARGIAFLVKDQNPDGSWGSARRTKGLNIYAPVPGAHHAFHTGTTALCLAAMLESADKVPAGSRAIDRCEAWMFQRLPHLRRADMTAVYNTWGHAYSIQALVRMYRRKPDDTARQGKIKALIEQQVAMLDRYEFVNGGWSYYDFEHHTQKPGGSPTSFTTATVLVALHEARQIGVAVPQKLVDRAVASIHRQRLPDFSYAYGEYLRMSPHRAINRPGGSLGRSQACNVALRLWGDKAVTDEVLTTWLERLWARNGWLNIGRKRPIPHESWFQVAGYFYYYGHYYAALCIEQLPEKDRSRQQRHLASVLLPLQEADGSWWDYPLYNYHQQYGTGFALMSLVRCREGEVTGKNQ